MSRQKLRPAIIELHTLIGPYNSVIEDTKLNHHLEIDIRKEGKGGIQKVDEGEGSGCFKKLARPSFTSAAQACRWCP